MVDPLSALLDILLSGFKQIPQLCELVELDRSLASVPGFDFLLDAHASDAFVGAFAQQDEVPQPSFQKIRFFTPDRVIPLSQDMFFLEKVVVRSGIAAL